VRFGVIRPRRLITSTNNKTATNNIRKLCYVFPGDFMFRNEPVKEAKHRLAEMPDSARDSYTDKIDCGRFRTFASSMNHLTNLPYVYTKQNTNPLKLG
jgi:hypothetical protein